MSGPLRHDEVGRRARALDVAAVLLLVLATLAVFAPALSNGFVDWDDDRNFLGNPHYRGLGVAQLTWMLTSALTGHWIPLTWLTLGVDFTVWGMNPVGYHLTNVLLHAAAAALVFFVARRLLALALPAAGAAPRRLGAVAAAAAFALHPLRAESVAWITERRDVLAGVFFLLTILAYLRACETERGTRRWWLGASVACHALALLSKSIVITLPVILLVLDVYPLRRGAPTWRGWLSRERRHLWLEKIPFLALSLAAGVAALVALRGAGYLTPVGHLSLEARLALAAYGVAFYLWKTLVPAALSPLYELPLVLRLTAPRFLAAALAVAALAVVLWRSRWRWPAGLAAGTVYAVILLPVSVRIHAGHQLVADRYSYFACLPWAIVLGGALAVVVDRAARGALRPAAARAAVAGVALWVVAASALTWQQVQVWRDTGTLWRHAIDADPTCAVCHSQLGAWLGARGRLAAARGHFERGLALRPDHGPLRVNRAVALLMVGQSAEAAAELAALAERFPLDATVHGRLGAALAREGNWRAAIAALERAVDLDPREPRARFELALVSLQAGDSTAARNHAEALRALDPALADQYTLVASRLTSATSRRSN